MGSTHVVKQLLFSIVPQIPTFGFNSFWGNFFTFWDLMSYFWCVGHGQKLFWGLIMLSNKF